jgi:hypothetical protein
MEDLFSANITVNNEAINYRVIFDQEKYVFRPETGNNAFPGFSLKREHDEWLEQEKLPAEIKSQAVDALENYLLKQH